MQKIHQFQLVARKKKSEYLLSDFSHILAFMEQYLSACKVVEERHQQQLLERELEELTVDDTTPEVDQGAAGSLLDMLRSIDTRLNARMNALEERLECMSSHLNALEECLECMSSRSNAQEERMEDTTTSQLQ